MTTIEYVGLADLGEQQLGAVRAIYDEAFPARQRVPFTELVDGARDGAEITVVGLDDGRPVAFSALSRLPSAGWTFLEYLAVDRTRRGHGLGSKLWVESLRRLAAGGEPDRVVLEVEDPAEEPAGSEEHSARTRRIAFYTRLGTHLLPVAGYLAPNVDGTGTEPMLLLAAVPPGAPEPGPAELRTLVRALYSDSYRLDPGHPLVLAADTADPDGTPR
ncbi:MAG TPA: GNAT family N-acetyltransferase [Mycobacteriales bacterium]|nr:GNAT family N-acetyltransferase [Mycobacteriales bacterium]